MNYIELKQQWKQEEAYSFKGWDFSHINGRWESQEPSWNYYDIVKSYMKSTDYLLDMGTGGGEFLLSLGHPFKLTAVTEAYPPNVALCKETLAPLGIKVFQTYEDDKLPFEDNCFDIVINRHESFDLSEVHRVLKQGGHFITQQVGGKNNCDLSAKLIKNFSPQFPEHTLEKYLPILRELKFDIIRTEEMYPQVKFFDVGALVYLAKVIQWEFPAFSVETCFERLCECQNEIERKGFVEGHEHRFLIVARKV